MYVRVELWKSWVLKNWCFWTVVLEKTLESPLDYKEIQPVILKEISPGCWLEGMMLKLRLRYFGHLMWRVDSLEKTLMLGAIGGRRRRGQQRMRWLNGITDLMDVSLNSGSWWWTGRPGVLRFMGSQRVSHDWATELNWTEACHSFPSKEQVSFHLMATVTIYSDFGAQENKIGHCFHFFSVCHEVMWWDATILIFECWVSSQFFHSPLSSISRGSSVPLHFLPLEWYHLHIWGCCYFSWQSWFQLVIPACNSYISHDVF